MAAAPAGVLRTDVLAGLTTAAVVIPKSMAYASIAGLSLETGLYTSLVPLVVYALAGTSRSAQRDDDVDAGDSRGRRSGAGGAGADGTQLVVLASTLTLMVGVALLAAAVLRLGFLADFISAPVLTGFKAGVAIVIVVDQLPKLLGIHIAKGAFLQSLVGIVQHVPDASGRRWRSAS